MAVADELARVTDGVGASSAGGVNRHDWPLHAERATDGFGERLWWREPKQPRIRGSSFEPCRIPLFEAQQARVARADDDAPTFGGDLVHGHGTGGDGLFGSLECEIDHSLAMICWAVIIVLGHDLLAYLAADLR